MPRKRSPLFDNTRSSPPRRHISPTLAPSTPSGPSQPRPNSLQQSLPQDPHQPSYGDHSALLLQPTYSETILQRPTIATDSSSLLPANNSLALPGSAVASPTSAQPQSRRQSSSSMRNASMTFENIAPTSTPTGRISKAKKGKRVHACEFPGCGKVFTRAEHRRRHELNHNPEAMYRCPHPGCGKAFHRVDLLHRHQERHDLEGSGPSSTQPRHPQHTPVMTSPPSVLPSSAMASPATNDAAPRSSGGLSIGSLVHPQSRNYAADPSLGPFGGMQPIQYFPSYTSAEEPYFYGSDAGHSPMSDNYGRVPHRQSISSSSSVAAFESPMMTSSMPGPWISATAPPSVLPPNMFEDGAAAYSASPTVNSMPIPLSELDGYEFTTIQRELSAVPGLLFHTDHNGVPNSVRWDCLDHYWKYFHPSFPVVHKPSGYNPNTPPLLASAMLAIGSFYDDRPDAKQYSLALQEIATRLLRRRSSITSRSRISDLQTVLLLEILGKYCARHASAQTSSRFRALFASLHQARQWLATNPLAVYKTLKEEKSREELAKAQKFWLEHETRRRIFHACSVLDSQQVSLFGQAPTIVSHESRRGPSVNLEAKVGSSIQLPCSEDLWGVTSIEEWARLASTYEYLDLATARATYQSASVQDYSFFQHQVINATITPPQRCLEDAASPLRLGAPLSKTRFNFHVFEMAKHTPIRHLLIVAGESWLLRRKVEQEADYNQAKISLRNWVSQSAEESASGTVPSTLLALWHALKVLRMIVNSEGKSEVFRTTYMLHEDWAVYLATLVCWVHGYRRGWTQAAITGRPAMTNTPLSPERLSTAQSSLSPPFNPPIMDLSEAISETYVYLTQTDTRSAHDLGKLIPAVVGRTKGLLETVRIKKFSHRVMGGLMNDAERVLYRLVEGRATSMF